MDITSYELNGWRVFTYNYSRLTNAEKFAIRSTKDVLMLYPAGVGLAPQVMGDITRSIVAHESSGVRSSVVVERVVGATLVGGAVDHYQLVIRGTGGRCVMAVHEPVGCALPKPVRASWIRKLFKF